MVMFSKIALPSALAASLMALMLQPAAAQQSRPVGQARWPALFDLDAAPADDAPPEPQAQPESRPSRLQAPGAGAAREFEGEASPELEPIAGEIRARLAKIASAERGAHPDDLAGAAAFYAGRRHQPIWTNLRGLDRRAARAMTEIRRAAEWGLNPAAFDLPEPDGADPSPSELAAAEIRLSLAVLKYARHARGGRIDYSEATDVIDEKSNVYEPRSVLQAIAAAESADMFLRGLHPKHAQFQRLRETLLAMDKATSAAPRSGEPGDRAFERGSGRRERSRTSSNDERQRIIVNMERWRLMPDDLGEFYVWNSIPEQYTRVIDRERVVLKERIVVGKARSPTPMFSARMQFVVFHPEWNVPNSIKQNELLPKLRGASGGGRYGEDDDERPYRSRGGARSVLSRMGLKVVIEGREIDPDSVNWGSVDIRRYQFVQGSGDGNVLGVVKFRFPNRHDVYMHDTPDKKLFGAAQRAFSHGCMRTQNPVHLAEVVLDHDRSWPPEYIRQLLSEEGKPKEIKLTNSIPVHVTYFTVEVDENGRLSSYPDVYGIDKRMVAALDGQPLRFDLKAQTQSISEARAQTPDERSYDDRPPDNSSWRPRPQRSERRRPYDDEGSDPWSGGPWERFNRLFER